MLVDKQDIRQIESIGKTLEETERELEILKAGIPSIRLHRRCVPGDGITVLIREEEREYAKIYDEAMAEGRCMKFVAASGAASRMFGAPFHCLQKGWTNRGLLAEKTQQGDQKAEQCQKFMDNLPGFAFFGTLKSMMSSKGLDLENLLKAGDYESIIENLLTKAGLGYETMPKAFIPFHLYSDGSRTALEEHMVESIGYLVDKNKVARIHFTTAPDYADRFRGHVERALSRLSSTGIHFDVTLSVQAHSTETVVLDYNNIPLRDDEGKIVLRPSGHGALLNNLNSLQGDIVFIRTIDNVLPDRFKDAVCFYKKVLGGYLVALQKELFRWLGVLSSGKFDALKLRQIMEFAKVKMNIHLPEEWDAMSLQERARMLFRRMNVPLRICGMVRNRSFPGGRPFWVVNEIGTETLQIIEPAQTDMLDIKQERIWNSCEFFNPADIVCGVRDYRGKCFDLTEFCNPGLSFVSDKTYLGRQCRILERPGLWNGSMDYWNTVFLEVPDFTLHPVKTILDLLNDQNLPDRTDPSTRNFE